MKSQSKQPSELPGQLQLALALRQYSLIGAVYCILAGLSMVIQKGESQTWFLCISAFISLCSIICAKMADVLSKPWRRPNKNKFWGDL